MAANRTRPHPDDWLESSHTLANIDRNFAEWHQGRPRYAFWAITLDKPTVRQRVHDLQTQLSYWLLPDYERQPHVTLQVCGFPNHIAKSDDDYDMRHFTLQILRLRQRAPKPFDIEIGGLSSFSSAPFLHVGDAQQYIAAFNESLSTTPARDKVENFIPHLTIGLYRCAWPKALVGQALDACECDEPLVCRITRLSLMTYETHTIKGPLSVLAEFDLLTHSVEWKSNFALE